jgi:anti-sigma factor RsiW
MCMCEREADVRAALDGELPESRRVSVAAHVLECDECRQLAAQLRRVSEMLRQAPLPALTAAALSAHRRAMVQARDQGVRILAEWLSIAAGLLLTLMLLVKSPTPAAPQSSPAPPAPRWEMVAVRAAPSDDLSSDTLALANLLADDLTPDVGWKMP